MTPTLADCEALDAADPLTALRAQFDIPAGLNYLDGNSLGVLPKATAARVAEVITQQWGHGLIRSWNTADWITLPQRIGDKIAFLIGAGANEVVAADSTSVNLYKVLSAALSIAAADAPTKRVILSERQNFPTDLYIAEGLARERGYELMLCDDVGQIDPLLAERNVAVLMLTHVNYRTGRMHDMSAVTRSAHEAGALMLWDLAHSTGAVPVNLKGNGPDAEAADFAIGCGYKYLNGGPGAPAFVWVHPKLADRFWQPLSGWMGHASPFEFTPNYKPAAGVARYLCGTPAVIAMAALEVGIDTVLAAEKLPGQGLAGLRRKSLALSRLFMELVDARMAGQGLSIASPRDDAQRGSQVSLVAAGALADAGYPIMQALIARHVIGDFRAPDILRFGFTPLYTRFVDVWGAVEQLAQVLASGEWKQPTFNQRAAVT